MKLKQHMKETKKEDQLEISHGIQYEHHTFKYLSLVHCNSVFSLDCIFVIILSSRLFNSPLLLVRFCAPYNRCS